MLQLLSGRRPSETKSFSPNIIRRALASLIETDENCLLRVLTANVVRQMLCNYKEDSVFKKSLGSAANLDALPISESADSNWLNRMMEYVNKSSKRCTSSGEYDTIFSAPLLSANQDRRERLYRVKRLEYQQGEPEATVDCPFLVADVSSDITLLMLEAPDTPTIFSVPIMNCLSVNRIFSESESYAVEIKFPDNVGYRIKNGTKNAVDSITIVLQDDESADSLLKKIQERQLLAHTPMHEAVPASEKSGNRASISVTFVDLQVDTSEAFADEHDKFGTFCTETQLSEFEVSSPLQDLSQRSLQKQAKLPPRPDKMAIDVSAETDAENSGSNAACGEVAGFDSVSHPSEHDARSRALDMKTKINLKQSSRLLQRKKGSEKEGTSQRVATPEVPDHGQEPSNLSSPIANRTEANEQANVKKTCTMLSVVPAANDQPPVTSRKLKSRTRDQHDKLPAKSEQTPATLALENGRESPEPPPPAPKKPALKKRSLKQSITGCNLSQARVAQDTLPSEFDLPSADQDSERPKKKAKVKSSKQPTKVPEAVGNTGERHATPKVTNIQKTESQRIRGRKKAAKSPNKKEPKTVASTRARRAVKTPAYVESVDIQSEDAQNDHHDAQTEDVKGRKEDNADYAEDSYPASKEQGEAALQGSELNFESNLQAMVSSSGQKARVNLTRQSVGVTEPGQKSTPMKPILPIKENTIPPVSLNKLRRTSIIQFGPHGPKNQATPTTPAATATSHTAKGILVQDQGELVKFRKRVSAETHGTDEGLKGDTSKTRPSQTRTNWTTDLENSTLGYEQGQNAPAAMDMHVELDTRDPERSFILDHDMDAHDLPKKDTDSVCIVDKDVLDVQDIQGHIFADNAVVECRVGEIEAQSGADGLIQHYEERSMQNPIVRRLNGDNVEVAHGTSANEATPKCSMVATSPQTVAVLKAPDAETNRKRINMTTDLCDFSRVARAEGKTSLTTPAVDSEIDEGAYNLESYPENDTSHSVSSSDDIKGHEPSEYITSDPSDSVMELSSATHDTGCQVMRSTLDASPQPETPLLEYGVHAKARTRRQETIGSQLRDQRSIGVATIGDQRHPQADKAVNTNTSSLTLRLAREVEATRVDKGTPPKETPDRSGGSARLNCWKRKTAQSTSHVRKSAQTSLEDPTRRTSITRTALPSMGPPPPRDVKPKAEAMVHRAPASDYALTTASRQAPLRKSGQKCSPRESTSTLRVAKETTEHLANAPVRVKKTMVCTKSTEEATISDMDAPPGTPMSFCTRLDMHAPTFDVGPDGPELAKEARHSARQSGDRSITLVDEDRSVLDRSPGPFHSRILRRSVSTEAMSPSDKPRNSSVHMRHSPGTVEVRSNQRGLLDSIMKITSVRFWNRVSRNS